MLLQLIQIAEEFAKVAEEEDQFLSETCDRGIFFMPELAYAYACGKAVIREAKRIFPGMRVNWQREVDVGLGGPSDLVFQMPNEYRIIVEFKMRDKIEKYLADVKKLARAKQERDARIFCVLLDPFTNQQPDKRIEQIQAATDDMIPLLEPFPHFPTKQDWYRGEISCLVAAWSVGRPPVGQCSGDAQRIRIDRA